jgi:serine protease Do
VYEKYSPKLLAAFREVVAEPARGTLRVLCGGKEVALGTVVGADGWVLTKASEVLDEAGQPKGKVVCRLRDGRRLEARVVGVQEAYDLALLKVEAKGLTPVEWRPSKEAAVGNWVATPGPGNDPLAVGVVSVATRDVPRRNYGRGAPAGGGGFLGVLVEPGEPGVIIREVVPRSAAAQAGLKVDDVILSLAGKAIEDVGAVPSTLRRMKPGDVVQIQVRRGDKKLDVKATLGRRPPTPGEFQNRLGGPLSEHSRGFPTVLQHDTALLPADCGGPLVDLDGKAVGINIARAGRTESYAVPAEVVQRLLPDLKSGKLAPRPPKDEADEP